MEQQSTIVIYETVAVITKQMLQAAKKQDWDELAELEANCAEQVAKLKSADDKFPLSNEVNIRKIESIKSILADDREIRNIVSPWMAKLNVLMNSIHIEGKLTRAYNR